MMRKWLGIQPVHVPFISIAVPHVRLVLHVSPVPCCHWTLLPLLTLRENRNSLRLVCPFKQALLCLGLWLRRRSMYFSVPPCIGNVAFCRIARCVACIAVIRCLCLHRSFHTAPRGQHSVFPSHTHLSCAVGQLFLLRSRVLTLKLVDMCV